MGRDPKFICQKPAPKSEQPQVLANLRSVETFNKIIFFANAVLLFSPNIWDVTI